VVDTQNKLSIVKQCRLLKFIGGLYYKETGKFRELENNAITRPTVLILHLWLQETDVWLKDLGFK
jgi:uncharacterized integral membrane protein